MLPTRGRESRAQFNGIRPQI